MSGANLFFYAVTIFIWGSTWLAITFQLGIVDPMCSVGYRFALASIILLIFCRATGRRLRYRKGEHLFFALQGLFLFCLNYWLFYVAEEKITSGLVAVVFSTLVVMNMLNGAIFLGNRIEVRVIIGAGLGLFGITLVFWPELATTDLSGESMQGVIVCLVATWLASLGNILSARNQKRALPVIQTNAYGMGYGSLIMLLIALITGKEFLFELSFEYIGSLLYLSIFGSIIAFGSYLTLVGKIGAERAAYTTLLFPLVALVFSTIFEGYQWSPYAFSGVVLILSGNYLALRKAPDRVKISAENSILARSARRIINKG